MFYSYTPKRTCSHNIEFEIDNGIVKHVSFAGGCTAISRPSLTGEGMPCEKSDEKLSGIECGVRGTSCADQLTKAIKAGLGKFIKRNRYGYGRFSVQKVHKRTMKT